MNLRESIMRYFFQSSKEKGMIVSELQTNGIMVDEYPFDVSLVFPEKNTLALPILEKIKPKLKYTENKDSVKLLLEGRISENEEIRKMEFESLMTELSAVGLDVKELPGDLIGKETALVSSIEILLKWVFQAESTGVIEYCFRLLTYPPLTSTSLAKQLINIVYDPRLKTLQKWTVGNTLSVIANEGVLEDLIRIIEDEDLGLARTMFIVALGNIPKTEVVSYLSKLLQTPEYFPYAGYTIMALDKIRAYDTIELIRVYENCPRKWIADQAKVTVKKFEKRLKIVKSGSHKKIP